MNTVRNSVRLIGRLGADPDVKTFENQKKLAKLNLATSESYTDQNGKKVDETQWHNLVMWGKQAEIAEKYLKKGTEIAVDGRLTSRSYEDKNGTKRYITEIVVREFSFVGAKKAD